MKTHLLSLLIALIFSVGGCASFEETRTERGSATLGVTNQVNRSAVATAFTKSIFFPKDATIANNSRDRRYSIYVPTSYRPGNPVPLVVTLHGCRQSDLAMVDKSRMHEMAEAEGFIVLYPFMNTGADGTGPHDDDGRNPNCWGYFKPEQRVRDKGEVYDIKRMVDKIKQDFSIDPDRVHITGISSGGAMANIAQVAYPDVFASAVIVEGIAFNETAGTFTGTQDCATVINNPQSGVNRAAAVIVAEMRQEMQKSVLRQAPVMVVHNEKDCTVPISVGMNLIKTWATLLGSDGKAIDMNNPIEESVPSSTDGLPWIHKKYGRGANNQSLLETFLINATAANVAAAGVVELKHDPYAPDSDAALKEDRVRGHWWAGGERGPWIIDKGPNTAQLAWNFFKTHPMQRQSDGGNGTGTWRQITDSATIGILTDTWYYVPKNMPQNAGKPANKRALMLTLHGCKQTASGHVINKGFNWEATAEKYGMVVVAPTKPNTPRSGTGQSNSLNKTCFDWFDESPHSRTNRDAGPLLNLIEKLKQMPELAIDPKQVYVSGLSGGAGEAQLLACLAPDVFSGVGLNETITLGSPGIPGSTPRTPQQVRDLCIKHAGTFASFLDKQVVTLACSDQSGLLRFCENTRDAYKLMWNANTANPTVNVPGGSGGGGKFTTFQDAAKNIRVGDLLIPGMQHAWPAGPGGSKNGASVFIDNTRVNFPENLTKFLFDNNQWYKGASGNPSVSCARPAAASVSSPVQVDCTGTDNSSVVSMRVVIRNAAAVEQVNHLINGASVTASYPLADGSYVLNVTATDNEGLSSEVFTKPFSVGAATDAPPVISAANSSVSGTCITVSGIASDDHGLTSVAVKVNNAADSTQAALTGQNYSWQKCSQAPGTYSLAVVATDTISQNTEIATTPKTVTVASAVDCINDLNRNHVLAARAYNTFGSVFALGSNNYLGLYTSTVPTSLKKTSPNSWARVASCT